MCYWIGLAIFALLLNWVDGHGRLFDPPSRSTAWRVGFNTPKDFNDMEGFCGGFERQWLTNKGKCGVCGDPYDEPIKPHQAPGGIFATGTIVRTYKQGQIIPVTIQITATHKGFYEFKLCPNNDVKKDPEQECFERFPLQFVGGSEGGKFQFSLENLAPATYQLRVQLPPDVTCTQCIFQWTYVTGNRWGVCPDGTGKLGCGPQESFRACSDIAITPSGADGATPGTTTTTAVTPMITPATTTQPVIVTTTPAPIPTLAPIPTVPVFFPTVQTTSRPTRRPTRRPRPTNGRPTIRTTTTFRPPIVPIAATTLFPLPTTTRPTTTTTRTFTPAATTTAATFAQTPVPAVTPPVITASGCPSGNYKATAVNSGPGMDIWCTNNCRRGYCPPSFCICA